MAILTQQYRDEAISLAETGLSLRQIERELTKRHGQKVVAFQTIHGWVQEKTESGSTELCGIPHA